MKYREIRKSVLEKAYDLFNLTATALDEEIREAYKAAVLKYHPDKGGNQEIFVAVHAAYTLIMESRQGTLNIE